MRRSPLPLVVLGCAALLVAVSLVLLRTSPSARAEREAEAAREARSDAAGSAGGPAALPAVTVDALTVEARPARTVVDVAGVLAPLREVVVGAEVEGRVVALEALEHAPVAEGDVLVRLDPALPRAAVERARAALLRARAAESLTSASVRRQRELARQGVSSDAALDRAESEARAATAQVAEAEAALLDAETRLAKTSIRAPFAGVVSALDLEPGAYLRPGEPVAGMVDLSEIEIEVGVSDGEILALSDGDPARVAVQALPGRWFEGRVVRPGRTADPQTRKYPVPVRVPNPDGLLLPGMLGTVRFELGDATRVLRIPSRCVVREFDLEYVFVLEPATAEEGAAEGVVARRRRVATRPVAFHPELLEVTRGLAAGERIVSDGLRELRDGLRVRVREPGPDAAPPDTPAPAERASAR